uniref:Uncharacterized protein n=1 Tax=Heterorhabditis bacteriophora TaxID=37862 RepID=A0A1I7WEC1_HETBA
MNSMQRNEMCSYNSQHQMRECRVYSGRYFSLTY